MNRVDPTGMDSFFTGDIVDEPGSNGDSGDSGSSGYDASKNAQSNLSSLISSVRNDFFSGSIPASHNIEAVIDPSVVGTPQEFEMVTSENGSSITVGPEIFNQVSADGVSVVVGHELQHVSDIIAAGGHISRGSREHYQSEINARNWELENASKLGVNLTPEQRFNLKSEIQNFQDNIKSADRQQQLLGQ